MLARGYRWRIDAAVPAVRLEDIRIAAKAAHRAEFTRRIPLYATWVWLGVVLSVSGFACAGIMIFRLVHGAK